MEKHDEQKFKKWCEQQGYLCLKLALATQRGWPDRTVITPTKVIFMEFKTQVGRLAAQQVYWINKLQSYPSVQVFVPRSADEAIEFVRSQLPKTASTPDQAGS